MASPDSIRLRADLIIGLLSLIWGTTYFVIRKGLEDLPPFTAAGVRFTLAAAVFAVVAHVLARREGGRPPGARLSLVSGLLNFACPYGIVYLTETRLPSGLVSVLWGTFPLVLAVLSHAFLPGERLGRRQWAGFGVGFAGVVLLFATDLSALDDGALAFGLLLLASPVSSALGNVYVKQRGAAVSSLLLTRNGLAVAAPLLLAAAALTERDASVVWSATAVLSVVYLALFGTVLTFSLYFWALRHAPAHRMGVVAYLSPTLALGIGSALGGEPFHWHTLVGTALVLGSVGLVLAARPARPPAETTPASDATLEPVPPASPAPTEPPRALRR